MVAKTAVRTQPEQGLEYTVYVYEAPENGKGGGKWAKKDTHTVLAEAAKQAEEMFKGGKYPKVEIKQKYFDKAKNRNIDVTLKTLEHKKKREISPALILAFALFCGALAFAATYFLTKDR